MIRRENERHIDFPQRHKSPEMLESFIVLKTDD